MGLASNLEQLGGAPAKVLFDNPKTVTLRDVAGAAVLNPELVRLAAHYRFGPQTTAYYAAPSKGKVEALVRFAKSDLIPYEGFSSLDEANAAARSWLAEVNSRPHSETRRPPVELLERERPLLRSLPALRPAAACGEERKVDRLATVRFASARYSVPHRLIGKAVEVQASDRELTVLSEGVPVAHRCWGRASARSRTPTTRARRRRAPGRCDPAPSPSAPSWLSGRRPSAICAPLPPRAQHGSRADRRGALTRRDTRPGAHAPDA